MQLATSDRHVLLDIVLILVTNKINKLKGSNDPVLMYCTGEEVTAAGCAQGCAQGHPVARQTRSACHLAEMEGWYSCYTSAAGKPIPHSFFVRPNFRLQLAAEHLFEETA